ncbi:hypothetical protein F3F02_09795 [Shigella flexneri]|nr:hypothetical protein [Shigella flexneri]
MLKLADIKFPITFESRGIAHYTYTDESTCIKFYGGSYKPEPSSMEIGHFIDAHNSLYEKTKDYGYAMPGYTCFHYKPYKGQVLPVRSPEREEIPAVEMKTCDYKKLWCLSVDNIKYPIVFRTVGYSTIRYTSPDNGVYSDGLKSDFKVDFFVDAHNKFNPHNEKDKVYYVEDITKHLFGDAPIGGGKSYFAQAIDNAARRIGEQIHSQTIKASGLVAQDLVSQSAIEDMPVAATLKGVRLEDGAWHELTAKPKTIEIHDDVVILLLHYGSAKNRTVAGEISIKRGTMVKWKVKV